MKRYENLHGQFIIEAGDIFVWARCFGEIHVSISYILIDVVGGYCSQLTPTSGGCVRHQGVFRESVVCGVLRENHCTKKGITTGLDVAREKREGVWCRCLLFSDFFWMKYIIFGHIQKSSNPSSSATLCHATARARNFRHWDEMVRIFRYWNALLYTKRYVIGFF